MNRRGVVSAVLFLLCLLARPALAGRIVGGWSATVNVDFNFGDGNWVYYWSDGWDGFLMQSDGRTDGPAVMGVVAFDAAPGTKLLVTMTVSGGISDIMESATVLIQPLQPGISYGNGMDPSLFAVNTGLSGGLGLDPSGAATTGTIPVTIGPSGEIVSLFRVDSSESRAFTWANIGITATAVPEPSGIVLGMTALVAGLACDLIRRRASRLLIVASGLRPPRG